MSETKIAFLPGRCISVEAVLQSILEREGVDGVVCVVRTNGAWATTWGGADLNGGSLSMAALKLLRDVMADNQDETAPSTLLRPI